MMTNKNNGAHNGVNVTMDEKFCTRFKYDRKCYIECVKSNLPNLRPGDLSEIKEVCDLFIEKGQIGAYNIVADNVNDIMYLLTNQDLKEIPLDQFQKRCVFCRKSDGNMKSCIQCRLVSYCSIQCQRNDWKKHKVECLRPYEDLLERKMCHKKIVPKINRILCNRMLKAFGSYHLKHPFIIKTADTISKVYPNKCIFLVYHPDSLSLAPSQNKFGHLMAAALLSFAAGIGELMLSEEERAALGKIQTTNPIKATVSFTDKPSTLKKIVPILLYCRAENTENAWYEVMHLSEKSARAVRE